MAIAVQSFTSLFAQFLVPFWHMFCFHVGPLGSTQRAPGDSFCSSLVPVLSKMRFGGHFGTPHWVSFWYPVEIGFRLWAGFGGIPGAFWSHCLSIWSPLSFHAFFLTSPFGASGPWFCAAFFGAEVARGSRPLNLIFFLSFWMAK